MSTVVRNPYPPIFFILQQSFLAARYRPSVPISALSEPLIDVPIRGTLLYIDVKLGKKKKEGHYHTAGSGVEQYCPPEE